MAKASERLRTAFTCAFLNPLGVTLSVEEFLLHPSLLLSVPLLVPFWLFFSVLCAQRTQRQDVPLFLSSLLFISVVFGVWNAFAVFSSFLLSFPLFFFFFKLLWHILLRSLACFGPLRWLSSPSFFSYRT